eukprot:8805308-Pyramimonas_sp.AAC.1
MNIENIENKELYKVPGGDEVDGLPPAPVDVSPPATVPARGGASTYLVELFGIDELEEFRRG